MRQKLRDYQERGWNAVLAAFRAGDRCVLLVSPTGSGKTTIYGHGTAEVSETGQAVLILVHRRELAAQGAARLREFGVDFGFILSGEPRRPFAKVQVASVQTLVQRIQRGDTGVLAFLRTVRFVVCDEAHLSTAATWTTVLEMVPKARVLGVTATPWRLGGKPLVGAYDSSVVVATPAELREQGHLCPYVGFAYLSPSLEGVETRSNGEYDTEQVAERMSAPAIVDNVVEQWLANASTLSTVVFAANVKHSKQMCERFTAAGVAAEHIDGTTPLQVRRAVLKRVEDGITRVLCNVGIAVEGIDIPRLKCIVDACPTKSLSRAIQKWGRGRRPWREDGQLCGPGRPSVVCRIHDHAFNTLGRHGEPDDERDFSLSAKPDKPPSLKTCEVCRAIYRGNKCRACGEESTPDPKERVLATVADAEQRTFSSGGCALCGASEQGHDDSACSFGFTPNADVPAPPAPKRVVAVKWNEPGREVEGRLLMRGPVSEEWGPRMHYRIQGKSREYDLPGTSELDRLMRVVQIADYVRVTYLEETLLPGGRTKKLFTVETNDAP